MYRYLTLLLVLISSYARADFQSKFEGFHDLTNVPEIQDPSTVSHSLYKIIIGPNTHGTAFAISGKNYLLTNVHNVTQCLRDYGMVETGYDGSQGALLCKSLSATSEGGQDMGAVSLLGSNPRVSNFGYDFAAVSVEKNVTSVLAFETGSPAPGENLFVVGYPGQTYRSQAELQNLVQNITTFFDNLFEFEDYLAGIDPQSVSTEWLFKKWIYDFFSPTQSLLPSSNFIAGSVLGSDYDLFGYQGVTPEEYYSKLKQYVAILKRDTYVLYQTFQRGLRFRQADSTSFSYPNANNTLKASYAQFARWRSNVIVIEGDATPGSSGSAALNSSGNVVGILFSIGTLVDNSTEPCVLDFMFTDGESVSYSYCSAMAPYLVPSSTIIQKLKDWNISL